MGSEVKPRGRSSSPSRWRKIRGSFWFNLVAAVAFVTVIQTFVVSVGYVSSGSMESTLGVGDRVLVNHTAYLGSDPHDGDVIVFEASDAWKDDRAVPGNPVVYAIRWLGGFFGVGPNLEHVLIKRVVAGPGHTVSCCDVEGRVMVDGVAIDEPYIFEDFPFEPGSLDCETSPASARCFAEVTIPKGGYFVLGDHRSKSDDSIQECRIDPGSSCLRTVRSEDIVGRAFVLVWPLDRWRTL
jgi:signal peptidase I